MKKEEIEQVKRALLLADMFFASVPATQGADIHPLGRILWSAIETCEKNL